ncbi:MAG: sialidase family protein [Ginsengibacter sp.]
MNKIGLSLLGFVLLASCSQKQASNASDMIIAKGQMPNIIKGKDNKLHLVYGVGDSIMYTYSKNNAQSFSKPVLISVLPHVFSFAMRGPQIAATQNGIVVTAATSLGDIFSFYKTGSDAWKQGQRVNDVDTIAKEGLMALSSDKENAYAVWLDLRGNKRNKIYGAKSVDGGKTWSANKMIYTSPDTTVCECCKPSVLMKDNHVYVMFRNWLQGNRDLYIIESQDGGNTFGNAQKLGDSSWKLNGCPMDGGGLAINKDGQIQTVWRRKGKIFSVMPGSHEKEIGEGKSCTIETINGKNIYAWIEQGNVVLVDSHRRKKIVGEGSQPVIKAINDKQLICIWESDKQIHAAVVDL